jgi:hypothetical protein
MIKGIPKSIKGHGCGLSTTPPDSQISFFCSTSEKNPLVFNTPLGNAGNPIQILPPPIYGVLRAEKSLLVFGGKRVPNIGRQGLGIILGNSPTRDSKVSLVIEGFSCFGINYRGFRCRPFSVDTLVASRVQVASLVQPVNLFRHILLDRRQFDFRIVVDLTIP